MGTSANDIGGLVDAIIGLVERNDQQSYRRIMVRAKNDVMPDDIKKTNMVVFQHMEFLSENEERSTDEDFLKSLKEHLISCGEIGDLGYSLIILPSQFQGAIKNHAEKVGGAHLESYNKKVAPFVSKLLEMVSTMIGEERPEFAEALKPENAGKAAAIGKKVAADSFMTKFMEMIKGSHPQVHKGITNSTTSQFFTDTANPLAIIYLNTLVEGADQISEGKQRIERIGELCDGLSLSSPIEGLKLYNDFLKMLLTSSGQNEENYPKVRNLHDALAEELNKYAQEASIDDEVSNMEFVEGALGVVNALEDESVKDSQSYKTMLYDLLVELKNSDPNVHAAIYEKSVDGKLPEIVETITANTLQFLHALSIKKSSINDDAYIDVIKKVLAKADDPKYLILCMVCVATQFATILKLKAQTAGEELQETYKELVLPAVTKLQDLGSELIVDTDSDDNAGLSLAINEIRKVNPEVSDAIQKLLAADRLALTLVKAIGNIVAELHDGPQEQKVEDFVQHSDKLFTVDGWTYSIIYGYMPAAFARLHAPKDKPVEQRVAAFVLKLYEIGEKLSELEDDSSPSTTVASPQLPEKITATSSVSQAVVFPWVNYSGFNSETAVKVANEAMNDDFNGKLATYKKDFNTPEHKASIDSHFGQFACAISMNVVSQYKAWANGDGAENKVVVGLDAYQELATYVAEDKDKSSENHVARLAFLGALLAYTNRNMPEPGKKTKDKVESIANMITESLGKKGVQLKAQKPTNLFGMIETLLGTK